MIYLDNAATTMIAPEVLEAMMPYMQERYGNPGSLHSLGRQASEAVETARRQVAKMMNCKPEQIVFTSGGTEGNNMIIKGLRDILLSRGKTHLVISEIEHDSVIRAAETLIEDGFYITYVEPNSDGEITAEAVREAVRDDTGLVSVMHVNNETGTMNMIRDIGSVCKERSILFHSDCVQSAAYYHTDVEYLNLDFATVSSHKIYGPKGVGAVFIRDQNLKPIISGGNDQEFGIRGGTENVPGIVGFGHACCLDDCSSDIKMKYFIEALEDNFGTDNLKNVGIYINGGRDRYYEKIINLRVDGVYGESLVLMMDYFGVCISAGSACRSHEAEPSRVLLAQGLTPKEARSSVRISFSKYNTLEEIEHAAKIMWECIDTLRSVQEDT